MNQEKRKNPNSSHVKCFFIHIHSDALVNQKVSYCLSNITISDARKLFMHALILSFISPHICILFGLLHLAELGGLHVLAFSTLDTLIFLRS